MTGSFLDADDLAQDTLMQVLEMGQAFENVSNPEEWLIVTSTALAIDALERGKPALLEEFDIPEVMQTTGPSGEPNFRFLEKSIGEAGIPLSYLFTLHYMSPEQRAVTLLRDKYEDGDRLAAEALKKKMPEIFQVAQEAAARREEIEDRWGEHIPFSPVVDDEQSERVFDRFIEVFLLRDRALLQQMLWADAELIVQEQQVSERDFVVSALFEVAGNLGGSLHCAPVWLSGCRGTLIRTWHGERAEWMPAAAAVILCDSESVRAVKIYPDGHMIRNFQAEEPEEKLEP